MAALTRALEELVTANRILAREGVVDAFGHASIRHPDLADRFILSRARAPECIEVEDLMQFTLEGEPIDPAGGKPYVERFIHAAVYAARPEAQAVVHHHSPSVIPFGITATPLRPVMHMCASMGRHVPLWDSRTAFGDTNLLVTNMAMARDLAALLGGHAVALMRGHGAVVAGPSLRDVVFNSVYLELNAQLQWKAGALGTVNFLTDGEIEAVLHTRASFTHDRAWGVLVPASGARLPTDVLIVGAGPVGLTLAVDLGRRGVRCTLIEQKEAPQFLPKMERCNARSMEMFRRMGLADKIRAAGLRSDVPMDVYVALALNEPPLLRLKYPSVAEAKAEIAACTDGSMPLEPYQLISQYTLEPLLTSEAERLPSVTVRFGCEFVSLSQGADDVTATVRSGDGTVSTISARYFVGCDGGASTVRRQLGIQLRGEANLLQLYQALYHCPELFDVLPIGDGPGKGRHYHIADAQSTFLIMQDSTRHWTLHARVEHPEDMKAQFERAVGVPVRSEMLFAGPWKLNLLLAERYRAGRVFLAGDAVHLVIPTGGLGMNTGVGDAVDLAWKLDATLGGWGGPNLLASYEVERRQVGDRIIGASRYAWLGRRQWRAQYRPNIRDATPDGHATREHLARVAEVEQRKSNEMIGAELGYRYVGSPIIWEEPGGPEHLFREYVPTTWPGARLPHVWLENQTAVQDLIGDAYTVLRLGSTQTDTSGLECALRALGAPVPVLTIDAGVARDVYGFDCILLRPDMHIAWRGNTAPHDSAQLAALVTGH